MTIISSSIISITTDPHSTSARDRPSTTSRASPLDRHPRRTSNSRTSRTPGYDDDAAVRASSSYLDALGSSSSSCHADADDGADGEEAMEQRHASSPEFNPPRGNNLRGMSASVPQRERTTLSVTPWKDRGDDDNTPAAKQHLDPITPSPSQNRIRQAVSDETAESTPPVLAP
eukprot:CAMPEP_0181138788 /NCGR_PEP_ID=MMETSP1071-20121207/34432_1 /TAXON_ID=35127 /ORGANISM="Thalassiosira sp., Strain NH16" /LENGTH=172 /DNA_ID=CAMNT_0023225645 /DNA_START=11 /DNA_END=527 /DNA_ORIENTATION=-